jgi:FtsH-binding integral membrane protein
VGLFLVTGFILFNFFGDPDVLVYIISVVGVVLITFPFVYRYSRILFLHLFGGVSYNPDYSGKDKQEQA